MKKYKIGIMGGTFNPIHNGHILLAQAAYDYCGLDKVWFMPSGVSYLKEQNEILPAEHRLQMVRLAVEKFAHFACSDIEIKREGNTYTVDTLRELSLLHPDCTFYFIMGADSFMALETWREPQEIAKLCTIVTVVRDDVDNKALSLQKEKFEKHWDASVVLVPFNKTDISSSEIRRNLQQGLCVTGQIPVEVEDYIKRENLYSSDAFLTKLEAEMKAIQSKDRFQHTLGVVFVAEELAKRYGIAPQKARIAAMLHDCAKCIPFDEQRALCETYQISLRKIEMSNTELLHSKLGAVLAKEIYGICDEEILDSIAYHTTGRAGMSMLEKIIFVADYIEPNRYKAKDLPMVRALAFENIDKAVSKILEDTLAYLKQKDCMIDESTVQTLDYYKKCNC